MIGKDRSRGFSSALVPVLFFAVLAVVSGAGWASGPEEGRANPPIYISFHWHMHQPIYWPYEKITDTMHNPDCTDAVETYLTWPDRVGAYTHYPVDTIEGNSNLPHMGAQISFSGSLIEDINDLAAAGIGYGRDWMNRYRAARPWKTAKGNPRLDLVAFGYHHPLMGLIDYADTRRSIADHRRIVIDTFGGEPSKGIFPPENAFSERMIPALVDEGIEWAMVDNLHFDRANRDYPWNKAQVMIPPNRADARNRPQPHYVSLSCQQNTSNTVSPGFGFRPHWVEYVDPATGKAVTPDGRKARMIAVPTERSLGYDDSYGDRDPVSRLTGLEKYNDDPAHPFLIVLAHDGDNAGASGSRYYLETCRWVQNNPDRFVITTVQDYLSMYPPAADDLIHVEDGSWTGADIGDMEFKKWNGDPYRDGKIDHELGYSPDRNSWAAITAAKNRVFTAQSVAPDSPNTARAWHEFMVGETSCYWYWDGTFEWDMKPTIASNNAVGYADRVLGDGFAEDVQAGKVSDTVPPTLFIPQREPYNPGGREWDKAISASRSAWFSSYNAVTISGRGMPSDFFVWTLGYDASGIESIELKYRVSAKPEVGPANLVYAGGKWNSVPMEGRRIPDVMPGLGKAKYKALEYRGWITGLTDAMVDYYVEAADGAGNVARTPIQHVWVGKKVAQVKPWEPSAPAQGDAITVRAIAPAMLHWGVNGWTMPPESCWPEGTVAWTDGKAVETPMSGPDANGSYSAVIGPFPKAAKVSAVDFVLHFDDNTWGADTRIPISGVLPAGSVDSGGEGSGMVPDTGSLLMRAQTGARDGKGFTEELLMVRLGAARVRDAALDGAWHDRIPAGAPAYIHVAGQVEGAEERPGPGDGVQEANFAAILADWDRITDEVALAAAGALDRGSTREARLLVRLGETSPDLEGSLSVLYRKVIEKITTMETEGRATRDVSALKARMSDLVAGNE